MTWIKIIEPADADGRLAKIYQRAAGGGQVDRILLAHSLRPHTLEGHMALYRSVLHHPRNSLDKAFAEAVGVLVSQTNGCDYCVAHHAAGMRRHLNDRDRADSWLDALESERFDSAFDHAQCAALNYAVKLTITPAEMHVADIESLQGAGWSDGEILEINQVAAYFAYANRTVLGLGVTTVEESLGGHPVG